MEVSVEQLTGEFQSQVLKTLTEKPNIHEAVANIFQKTKQYVCELIGTWYTEIDHALLEDRSIQRRYKVQHKGRERTVYTELGTVTYYRTYYKDRSKGKNVYLVDKYNQLEPYQRLSDGLRIKLVGAALSLSYRKTSKLVTDGNVSAQSVMNSIRRAEPVEEAIIEKRHVSILHLDADEDHIKVRECRKAKSDITRLLVSYEGVNKGSCVNPNATGRYGMTPSDFWDEALASLQNRYDLTDTKIYLHADGAHWIAMVRECLPDVIFVLDKFHKNAKLKKITNFLSKTEDKLLGPAIREALSKGQRDIVKWSFDLIRKRYAKELTQDVNRAMTYLLNNIDGIAICERDPEANNGGCSEPHVSNYLSDRMSSRPKVWSEKTLKAIVPLLTARREIRIKKKEEKTPVRVQNVVLKHGKKYDFDMDPSAIGNVPVLAAGKVTPLYNSLRWLNN